jgi:KipI family sensor histidine kinase inhibitor
MADWVALGDRAIRFARPARSARAIVRAVKAWPGVVDVVVSRGEVAAYFADAPQIDAGLIRGLADAAEDAAAVRDIVIAARYDGPDLAYVAGQLGRSVEEVCALHAAATYTVEMMGFSPGFGYLAGLPDALVLPRRTTPRVRVPAGSIAIAGAQTAVYPFDSPGGWHLIGSTSERMFGADGALLSLGDRVRFVP